MSRELYERRGRPFVPASVSTIVDFVMKRSDVRDAIAAAIEAHPLTRCRTCGGDTDGGRVVQIAHGGHRWMTCAECLRGEVVRQLPAAVVPGDA